MRVKMKTTMAGPRGSAGVGEVVDLADDVARSLVAAGAAETVNAEVGDGQPLSSVEHATHAPPLAAVGVAQRKGRRR